MKTYHGSSCCIGEGSGPLRLKTVPFRQQFQASIWPLMWVMFVGTKSIFA